MENSTLNILKENNFKFKKALGQNFITDTNLLSAMVKDANITNEDTVVEIGPGAGTLTKEIAKKANKVYSFEIDTQLESILKEYKYVKQIHGFFVDKKNKNIFFDIIIDFDCESPEEVKNNIINEIHSKYPEYEFNAILDADITD